MLAASWGWIAPDFQSQTRSPNGWHRRPSVRSTERSATSRGSMFVTRRESVFPFLPAALPVSLNIFFERENWFDIDGNVVGA
jgi:hypothetical protein